jgi:hypothetical protein
VKEKHNEELVIDTRCGLHCFNCTFQERTGCGGCIATNGHPFHGECSLAACCQNKDFLHCGQCLEFPCEQLKEFSYDKEHGDNGERIEQIREWNKIKF